MELVYVVAADMQEAEKLAMGLLDQRLAACVNIFPPVRSFYLWKGRTESSDEVVFLVKTVPGYFPLVEEFVRKHHSYEVPAVFSIPVERVSEPYRRWIFDVLDQGKES
jgi:periplasmic divalent cation tolerance protein